MLTTAATEALTSFDTTDANAFDVTVNQLPGIFFEARTPPAGLTPERRKKPPPRRTACRHSGRSRPRSQPEGFASMARIRRLCRRDGAKTGLLSSPALSSPETAVSTRASRGRQLLREILEKEGFQL